MDARSALFDLYGDHLRRLPVADPSASRGQAPVAALVRLMAPLGVQAPAVRTAVSRMVRQGWLTAVRMQSGPGYALTPRALRRLDDAAERVYRTAARDWDGNWHLLVVTPPEGRAARQRLHAQLSYFGYGALGGSTWISPRPAPELDAALAEADARAERFVALHDGDARALIARAWDLESLACSYTRFLDAARLALDEADTGTDEGAFAARSVLVHAWRKFLFVDPALPTTLLPPGWPGVGAAVWFHEEAARLLPAARRFVLTCLEIRHV
ncbi:MAG: putative transcriptional regulator, PaaX family [Frankiales bacterium]|nr:putative transcriptional regulator, PaaX family [Frankiales bacterium]